MIEFGNRVVDGATLTERMNRLTTSKLSIYILVNTLLSDGGEVRRRTNGASLFFPIRSTRFVQCSEKYKKKKNKLFFFFFCPSLRWPADGRGLFRWRRRLWIFFFFHVNCRVQKTRRCAVERKRGRIVVC